MEHRASVTDEVVEKLKVMIAHNELRPGERFPSERVLAQDLGVSRSTVREAIHYFEVIGIASTRQGSGTYLVDDQEALQRVLDARQVLGRFSLQEMLQARRVVEMGIVRIAAQNANREDKIAIRNALKNVDATSQNAKTDEGLTAHILADHHFHREIARSTHNAILMELQATQKGVFMSAVEVWKKVTDTCDVANPAHAAIAEAIENNDPIAAVEAMEGHLQHMEYLIDLSRQEKNT